MIQLHLSGRAPRALALSASLLLVSGLSTLLLKPQGSRVVREAASRIDPGTPIPTLTPEQMAAAQARIRHIQWAGVGVERMHRFDFPDGTAAIFSDHPKKRAAKAKRARVVQFRGLQLAGKEPVETFARAAQATGLPSGVLPALQFVSKHEGGFDAINTWDSARFSWGFIQFAGGRGLPRLMAHIQERSPRLFFDYFGQYGIGMSTDSEERPQITYRDPQTRKLLVGAAAEQRFGDDLRLTALFVHAAQVPEIKQLQIEAAIEAYVQPALANKGAKRILAGFRNSVKGMAMLIDRQVQEGNLSRMVRAARRATGRAAAWEWERVAMIEAMRDASTRGHAMAAERLRNIFYSELPGPV